MFYRSFKKPIFVLDEEVSTMPFGMGPAGWAYINPYPYPYVQYPYLPWFWRCGRRGGWARRGGWGRGFGRYWGVPYPYLWW
jgi:hypothetical protein